jgi:hypothetical protein
LPSNVHTFDNGDVMSVSELEILRVAAMPPLRHEDVDGLLEACNTLAGERQQLIDIANQPPPIWTAVPDARSSLDIVIGGAPIPPGRSGAGGG